MAKKIMQITLLFLTGAATACGAAQSNVDNNDRATRSRTTTEGANVAQQQSQVSERFATLDEYLAWLKQHEAPAGGAWYVEVEPGVYELGNSGNLHLDGPAEGKQRYTRAELMKKFGFSQ